MPSKKKGTYQGKAESPQELGQQKLPSNYVTNLLAPTTRLYPINTRENWGSGPFRPHTLGEGGRPWLESVINSPIAVALSQGVFFPDRGFRLWAEHILVLIYLQLWQKIQLNRNDSFSTKKRVRTKSSNLPYTAVYICMLKIFKIYKEYRSQMDVYILTH